MFYKKIRTITETTTMSDDALKKHINRLKMDKDKDTEEILNILKDRCENMEIDSRWMEVYPCYDIEEVLATMFCDYLSDHDMEQLENCDVENILNYCKCPEYFNMN